MTEDETVEQVDNIDQVEKEAREYSQAYIRELIAESKKYMPPTVWDHLHRKARSAAGGKASGKSRRDAAEAANAQQTTEAGPLTPELTEQLQEAQAEPTKKADDDCEVAAQKCEAMKAKASKTAKSKKEMAVKAEAPANIVKEEIEPFVGSHPLISFVAASPGIIESVRKSALVGTTGRIFNSQYLEPLGLKRDDIAILYLVPKLLKSDDGKVREPTEEEITHTARHEVPSGTITVALGHTVKKSLGRVVDVTLPHPNALGTVRTNQELIRKREQLKKMLSAKKAQGNKTHLNTPQENL